MPDKIHGKVAIREEGLYRSKPLVNMDCDRVRVVMEMPLRTWSALKRRLDMVPAPPLPHKEEKTYSAPIDMKTAIKCVQDEPEIPDSPPQSMINTFHRMCDEHDLEFFVEILRTTVKVNKQGIIERMQTMENPVDAMREKYDAGSDGGWGEHPDFPFDDWRFEAGNGNTRLGYWEWVCHQIEDKEYMENLFKEGK